MVHAHNCFNGKSILSIIGMVLVGVLIAAVLGLLFGFIVMWLWNWLMPAIFGLGAITFWQAWGLVLLTHILFKSHAHPSYKQHNDKWKEHFKKRVHEHKTHHCCEDTEEKAE